MNEKENEKKNQTSPFIFQLSKIPKLIPINIYYKISLLSSSNTAPLKYSLHSYPILHSTIRL
jgi:hypothetical protein